MTEPTSPLTTLARLSSLVRLSHTVFGLPFALAAAGLGLAEATLTRLLSSELGLPLVDPPPGAA